MKSRNYRQDRIRVCVVVASLDILGGQSIQASRLLEGLSTEPGVEATILPINPRLPLPLGWLQRIKYVRTIITSIAYVGLLLARLRRFDVVHVFSASYLSFLLSPTPAILIAKLYGKAVLLNYHSGEAEDHLTRWGWVALPIINLADRVVVPSEYLVEVFERFGVRAEAISNTVDLDRFGYGLRLPLRPVLLSNRNFESHYNVAGTLRAFALIQKHVPEASLIVAGEGSQREALRSLARDLNLTNVEFTGAVAPEQIPELYRRADIFVNSSNVDNMPLSIIEAFASGLPVVTTGAGGIPYLVKDMDTGLLVQCGDYEGLAANVQCLLEDQALASRIATRAREECRKYDWSAVGGRWLDLYSQMAQGQESITGQQVEAAQRL